MLIYPLPLRSAPYALCCRAGLCLSLFFHSTHKRPALHHINLCCYSSEVVWPSIILNVEATPLQGIYTARSRSGLAQTALTSRAAYDDSDRASSLAVSLQSTLIHINPWQLISLPSPTDITPFAPQVPFDHPLPSQSRPSLRQLPATKWQPLNQTPSIWLPTIKHASIRQIWRASSTLTAHRSWTKGKGECNSLRHHRL